MSSNSHNHRDAPLPPISHILRDTDSHVGLSSLSLPPLRSHDDYSRRQDGTIPSKSQRPVAQGSHTSVGNRHDHGTYSQNDPISSGNYTTYQHQHSRRLYSSSNYHPPSHHEMLPSSSGGFQPATNPFERRSARPCSTAPVYSGGSDRDVDRPAYYEGSTYGTNKPTSSGQHYSLQAMRYSHPDQEIILEEQGSTKSKYECNYCGKGFLRPSALRVNSLDITHRGQRLYTLLHQL
ncbi:hypothetical protein E1B28_010133 [Marasmius oreades]|uniref:C2H2-type domain-containing protein n=1 Tax=Marasmius oreades TaxID=181124 RepID=A0A9P7RWH1_9AGAR|nr:uncharacterized protein E1B28_010133 [Marasmius oreades]KAG7091076.1 hypothetical protein E1B28_010133 [Marasmius oreades]